MLLKSEAGVKKTDRKQAVTGRKIQEQVKQADRDRQRQTGRLHQVNQQTLLLMEDYTLPFWIYLCVLTVFIGGAMKKILASHLSTTPTLVAWLGATVLVERLWAFCLPAVLLLALLGLTCCIYSATRTGPPSTTLPARGKAVFITGKRGSAHPLLYV